MTTFDSSFVFEAAGAVGKIDSGLKSKHNLQILLAQIDETHCTFLSTAIVGEGVTETVQTRMTESAQNLAEKAAARCQFHQHFARSFF